MRTTDLAPTFPKGPDGWPFCVRCQRRVERIDCETPIVDVTGPGDVGARKAHTGEIIIRVVCHGEVFSVSSWRGVL